MTTGTHGDERGARSELEAGLRRLRLRGMRELAPELLQTAKTQRWPPHELLATLVCEEIASREASNKRARLKAAGFPAPKTLDGFDLKASTLPRPTFEFLASLQWLQRNDNLCLAGPAGVGKSHSPKRSGRDHRRQEGPLLRSRPADRSALADAGSGPATVAGPDPHCQGRRVWPALSS
jgi:hypothetical protein